MSLVPLEASRTSAPLGRAAAALCKPAAVGAILSLCAGALHLVVTVEHFREWWGYGVFFLGVGGAQVLFALLVVRRPGTMTAIVGVAGNLGVVGLYVVSRTIGVPVGPRGGDHRLEQAGPLDLSATAVEVMLIMLLVTLMPARAGRATVNVLLVAGVGLWALRFSGILA